MIKILNMSNESDVTAGEISATAEEAFWEGAFRTGELADAERLFGEARALARRDGDKRGEASAAGWLGLALHYRYIGRLVAGGELAEAEIAVEEELMRQALSLWQETGDAAGTARALFGMSVVYQVLRRDWAAAMPYLWQSFGLAEAVEEAGDLYGRSEIHRHVGFYYLIEDVRPKEAVRQLTHSLTLRERIGDPRRVPSALVALGEAEIAAGNPRRAVDLFTRAVTLAREAGLLAWRIQDAEQNLRQAQAVLSG